jgi:NADPH:quinone reductase-like Zn-dependent oxidoreductase
VRGEPELVADLMPHIAAGRIRPVIDRVFAFGELAGAKAHMEADRHVGKIVVGMPGAYPAPRK